LIFKKKILDTELFSSFLYYLKKIIFSLGILSFIFLFSIVIYYYSSGLQKLYTPSALVLKINDKVLKRYVGFDIRHFPNYMKIVRINLFKNFTSNNLENVKLEIGQKSILGLELQRKLRSENYGELSDDEKIFLSADIKFGDQNYPVKLRTKGVRSIHWKDKDKTSYKVDIRGDKRLWGMEEFSFQKPITRNYTYEYLFHKLLGHVGLININYFFINLFINDQSHGVYAVEESFSKELVERQKKRNGPIFSLKDELGEYFPNVSYELYSDNYWISQYPKLTKDLFSILNNLKNSKKFELNNHFDINKWAKYFAIMDLTGAYHGSLAKSVKFFYNPTTALFEPIGYDLHKGAGIFDNFILIDFLQEAGVACSYICEHREWFFRFLKLENGELNYPFLEKYIKYLTEFSEEEFIDNFLDTNSRELSNYNNAIYKDFPRSDKSNWIGAGFFVYDDEYLFNRAKLIKKRINSTDIKRVDISKIEKRLLYEDYQASSFPFLAETFNCEETSDKKKYFFAGKMSINFDSSCKKLKLTSLRNELRIFDLKENIRMTLGPNIYFKNNLESLSEDINFKEIEENTFRTNSKILISKNSIIKSNQKFIFDQNSSINITNNSTLFIEGQIDFNNNIDNLTKIISEDGTGSLIFFENRFDLKNLVFKNLSKPILDNYILYGGVNFINSKVYLDNIYIENSNNEDGMNIINSDSEISNIYFENIKADAFDIDFGRLDFDNIKCKNINNDCLDISGADVSGSNILSINTLDKGISVGENSRVNITNLNTINNNIGLAVKDGSKAKFSKINFDSNKFDIVLFNKKQEFLKPSLVVGNLNEIVKKKILQSKDTNLKINNQKYLGNFDDKTINALIY
tara:strand:- start:28 stop:2607 length:2580 start_codon:yes stop_codon:yes gene_type:complete